jgi:DNA-binding IclR family transcriptional regulator
MLPRTQVTAIFASHNVFVDRTGRGPQSLRELKALLASDRARGWSVEDGHTSDGVTCIAAAVTDKNSVPVASFSVAFRDEQVRGDEARARVGRAVRDSAAQLTRRLGGDSGPVRQSLAG